MENNEFKDENFVESDQEEIFESFVCCVCLDLLYKPIVLSCGHIACFWCVYRSMDGLRESHCPICRNPYYHFPTICQMLHFLLLKMYPAAYKRRENQTLKEEKKMDLFSPQFDAYILHPPGRSPSSTIVNPVADSCSMDSSECMEESGSATHKGDEGTSYSEHTSDRTPEAIETASAEGKNLSQNEHHQQPKILVEDVMCTMCKQLLFHPVVLNCGHVYCESCVINSADEMLRCQVCQTPHPRGYPKVCLALDHFLEERFLEEYTLRRELDHIKVKSETTSSCSLQNDKGEKIARWPDRGSKVHLGVGCDNCGIYPITGDRYRCCDCKEFIGFDLCGDCYNTRSKLPGRFNQQHKPEHQFKLIPCYGTILGGIDGYDNLVIIGADNLLPLVDDEEDNQNGEDNQNDSEATN